MVEHTIFTFAALVGLSAVVDVDLTDPFGKRSPPSITKAFTMNENAPEVYSE